MIVKKKEIINISVVILTNLLVFLLDGSELISDWSLYIIITGIFFYLIRDFKNYGALGIIILVGGLVLYTFPYLGELLRGNRISPIFYTLFLLAALILFRMQAVISTIKTKEQKFNWLIPILCALTISLIGLHIWPPIFSGFYAIGLIFLERSCRNRSLSQRQLFFHASFFYFVLLYYMMFVWSGFGRLYFLTYLILPLLILFHYKIIKIRAWQLIFIAPFGLIYGTIIRGAETVQVDNFAGGSASHHLELMEMLRSSISNHVADLSKLIDQFVLYFLNWYPREIWSNKPIGIGSWFVDEYIGREGFSDLHSVSLGLWGEHIYLNPDWWLITGTATIIISSLCAAVLYKVSFRTVAVLLMFQANLLTLFWGGLASFGSRVWWMVLPAIMYIWIEKLIKDAVISHRSSVQRN